MSSFGNSQFITNTSSYPYITYPPATTTTIDQTYGSIHTTCHGHVTDAGTIEYQDGLVVAYCKNCEARITIERLPGGVNKTKLATILANLRNEDPELQAIILDALLELEIDVTEEITELQNALMLLQAAKDEACRRLNC